MIPTIQNLISALKDTRKAKGLSQGELADKLGIPQSHLSRIESGHVNIQLSSLVEMARMLELEVMLIPRQEVSLVKGLIASKEKSREGDQVKPAYTLDDEE